MTSADPRPWLQPQGCSVHRRSQRHGSPKALPEPCALLRGGVVPMPAGAAVRAGVPPDGHPRGAQEAGGTATPRRPAPAAVQARRRTTGDHPASLLRVATC